MQSRHELPLAKLQTLEKHVTPCQGISRIEAYFELKFNWEKKVSFSFSLVSSSFPFAFVYDMQIIP